MSAISIYVIVVRRCLAHPQGVGPEMDFSIVSMLVILENCWLCTVENSILTPGPSTFFLCIPASRGKPACAKLSCMHTYCIHSTHTYTQNHQPTTKNHPNIKCSRVYCTHLRVESRESEEIFFLFFLFYIFFLLYMVIKIFSFQNTYYKFEIHRWMSFFISFTFYPLKRQ